MSLDISLTAPPLKLKVYHGKSLNIELHEVRSMKRKRLKKITIEMEENYED